MASWNERRANTQHHRWYRNLRDLHAITLGWVKELDSERPAHGLPRGLAMSDDVSQTLWMIDRLVSTPDTRSEELDGFLDDSSPDDLLARLERTIWAVQGWTLSAILERAGDADRAAVRGQLEQSCWRSGRDCAHRRWPSLDLAVREDARGLIAALRDNPLFGRPDRPGILLLRNVAEEARYELFSCPHRLEVGELPAQGALADELCQLHSHWIRGFSYALNTRSLLEHHLERDQRRCWQRLHFGRTEARIGRGASLAP